MSKRNNTHCLSAIDMLKAKVDVKGGGITFGQRIRLGEIFQSSSSEASMFEDVFMCLHNYKPSPTEYRVLVDYFESIVDGVKHWLDVETLLLTYTPTSEEVLAGVKELSAKVGNFGTTKALAKAYNQDPDNILAWEYGKVFGILYTDLEEYKYQQRYNNVLERKYKSK